MYEQGVRIGDAEIFNHRVPGDGGGWQRRGLLDTHALWPGNDTGGIDGDVLGERSTATARSDREACSAVEDDGLSDGVVGHAVAECFDGAGGRPSGGAWERCRIDIGERSRDELPVDRIHSDHLGAHQSAC